ATPHSRALAPESEVATALKHADDAWEGIDELEVEAGDVVYPLKVSDIEQRPSRPEAKRKTFRTIKVKQRPLSYYDRFLGVKVQRRPLTYYDRFLRDASQHK